MQSIPGIGKARHLIQEFTFEAEYAYDMGMPQWLARLDQNLAHCASNGCSWDAISFIISASTIGISCLSMCRDSAGSANPEYAIRPKRVVEEIVRGHTSEYRNHTLELPRLSTVELVQRQLIEQN